MELAGDKLWVTFRLVTEPTLHSYEFCHFPDRTIVGIEDTIVHGFPHQVYKIVAFVNGESVWYRHAPIIDLEIVPL